jgi:hypothetical protein
MGAVRRLRWLAPLLLIGACERPPPADPPPVAEPASTEPSESEVERQVAELTEQRRFDEALAISDPAVER